MKKRISSLLGSKGVKGVFGAGVAMALLLGSVPAGSAEETTADTNKTCETTSVNPMGQATPKGSKDGYTIFVKEHAILSNSELEGTLAVGGKATFGDARGNQNLQYPIFHGGVGGNANYDVPTIDGVPNRVLIQEFESTNKVVQIQTRGAEGDNAKAGGKIADQTKPADYTFGRQFGGSGSTYYPADGGNQSPQIESQTQPFTTVEDAKDSWGTKERDVLSFFPDDQGGILSTYNDWASVTPPTGDDSIIKLDGKKPSKLDLSQFAGTSKFVLEDYTENSFLVIKASPSDVKNGTLTLPSYSTPGKESPKNAGISHILFDLSEISGDVNITTPNEPIRGSIYAPDASITIPSEQDGGKEFEGQIIAKNFTALQGGKEMHTNLFHGRFPGSEGGDCGGFSLEKKLVDSEGKAISSDAVFEITAKWTIDGEEMSQDFELKADGTVANGPQDLPEGTVVTFSEPTTPKIDNYTFDKVSFSPEKVEIIKDKNAAVTATNTYTEDVPPVPSKGLVKVNKQVDGTGADLVTDPEFSFTAVCTPPEVDEDPETSESESDQSLAFALQTAGESEADTLDFSFKLKPNGTWTKEIPAGYTCVITEETPEEIDGATFDGVIWDPAGTDDTSSASVVVEDGETAAFTATNTYTREESPVGGFSLEKKLVDSEGNAISSDAVFKITAKWTIDGEEKSQDFELKADGTVVDGPQNLPVGTVVTFSEPTAPTIDNYTFDKVSFSPEKATIGKDENAAVTATNIYKPTGEVVVEKKVTGPKGAEVTADKDAVFQLKASWTNVDGTPGEKLFDVTPGKPVSLAGLPLNTDITLSEVGASTSVDNVKWGDIIWSGEGVVDEPGASKDATLNIKDGSKPVSVGLENKTSSNGLIIIPIPIPLPSGGGSSNPPTPNTPGAPSNPGTPSNPENPSTPQEPGKPGTSDKGNTPGGKGSSESTKKGGGLANTGANVALLAGGAILLLIGGAWLVLRGRKEES